MHRAVKNCKLKYFNVKSQLNPFKNFLYKYDDTFIIIYFFETLNLLKLCVFGDLHIFGERYGK